MNEQTYRAGAAVLRVLSSIPLVSRALDLFAKVWLRQRKLEALLRQAAFDGVIDGGANVGEFAFIVRKALPRAHLICVEPQKACVESLRRDGFEVVEAALWSRAGKLRLLQPTLQSTSASVTENADASAAEVAAVRLDSIAISGARLLIKLDLQGAEFAALEGMGALWDRCAGLLVEVSIGPGGTAEKMRELLSGRGFYEYSTTNELMADGRVVEADKLWLRSDKIDIVNQGV